LPNDPLLNGTNPAHPYVPRRGIRGHGRIEGSRGLVIGSQYTVPNVWREGPVSRKRVQGCSIVLLPDPEPSNYLTEKSG